MFEAKCSRPRLEQGIIAQPVDLRGALGASVIADALKAPGRGR